jgi:hypothetical protein
MSTNRSIRAINLSTALLLLGGTVGCDVPPGDDAATPAADTTSIADKLNPAARKMALDNQAQQQKDGLQLVGRVWFAPDAYGEIFDDSAAADGLTTFVSRGSSPLLKEAELTPREEESLDEYIARTRPGLTPVRFDLASGAPSADALDVLLFQPAPAAASAGDVTSVTSALLNEFCDIPAMNARCASNFGWAGPVTPAHIVAEWVHTDVVGFVSAPHTGNSSNMAVCADRGSATMTIYKDGAIRTVREVTQGFSSLSRLRGTYWETPGCARYAGIWCIDWYYTLSFEQHIFMQRIATQGTGANAHVCGRVKNNKPKTQDVSCGERNNCPVGTE